MPNLNDFGKCQQADKWQHFNENARNCVIWWKDVWENRSREVELLSLKEKVCFSATKLIFGMNLNWDLILGCCSFIISPHVKITLFFNLLTYICVCVCVSSSISSFLCVLANLWTSLMTSCIVVIDHFYSPMDNLKNISTYSSRPLHCKWAVTFVFLK